MNPEVDIQRLTSLSYAIVTPARDERDNLQRLGSCLARQTLPPSTWLVVDDGSVDGSRELVSAMAGEHEWVRAISTEGTALERGAPIVRAFHAALHSLEPLPDVVVKLDADISIPTDHFEQLLRAFELNARLGIAGGAIYEEQPDGVWRRRHGTGPSVWGACRAYRRECLREILPLEEHMGWDTLDLMKAELRGWQIAVIEDLPFRHHRAEGERDGHPLKAYMKRGEGAYYMGYRIPYLALRTLFRIPSNPAAVGLLIGYARAQVLRRPRCADPDLRRYVRSHQRLRKLPIRAREALRPRTSLGDDPA